MEKIGLFWGSTTGNQEEAAKFLTDYMVSRAFKLIRMISNQQIQQKC